MAHFQRWLLLVWGLLLASPSWAGPSQEIRGIYQLSNTDGNTNAITYHDGILFLATQVGVELYLTNQVIGNVPYSKLTNQAQISRDDKVYLLPDTVNDRIIVWDYSNRSIGSLDYKNGAARCAPELQAVAARLDTNRKTRGLAEEAVSQVLQRKKGWEVTAAVENKLLSLETGQQVWLVGTKHAGLFQCVMGADLNLLEEPVQLNFSATSKSTVRHILSLCYIDEFDAVAIGTCGDGAFLWSQRRDRVFTPVIDPQPGDDGQERHFWSFAKVDDSEFLAGNDMGRIFRYDHQGQCKEVLFLDADLEKIKDWQVRCIEKIPGKVQQFLVGTNYGMLFVVDLANKGRARVRLLKSALPASDDGNTFRNRFSNDNWDWSPLPPKESPSANPALAKAIYCMQADTNNQVVWIGAGNGVWLFDPKGTCVQKSRVPTTFLCLRGSGVYVNGGRGILDYLHLSGPGKSQIMTGLPRHSICNLLFLNSGKLLVFTRDSFACIGSLDNGRFVVEKSYTDQDGLAFRDRLNGNQVYPMFTIYGGYEMASHFGRSVWCSTNFGIVRINLDNPDAVVNFYYKTATGLPAVEFNTNAFTLLNDSLLVFGSRRGLLLVNTFRADKYLQRNRPKAQLWKVTNEVEKGLKRSPFRYVQQTFTRLEEGSRILLFYDDKSLQLLPIVPDYSLLESSQINLGEGIRGPIISSGRSFPPELLLGTFSHRGRVVGLKLHCNSAGDVQPDAPAYSFFQMPSTFFWETFAFCLIGFTVALSIYYKGKRQKAEALRQKLFVVLSQMAAAARSYEDLHTALKRIEVGTESILGSTKIAINVYEKGLEQLRSIAYAGTSASAPTFETISQTVYKINDPNEKRRPLVWQWIHGDASNTLVKNCAADFYGEHNALSPKIGPHCESFIFKTLEVNHNKAAILSIQNERPNAYTGKEGEKILELLDMVGYFVSLSLHNIDQARVEAVALKTIEHFNHIADKRMSQHISANFVERIGRLYPESRETTTAFKSFLSMVYSIKPVAYGNVELHLISRYLPLAKFLYNKSSIELETVNKQTLDRYKLPTFILLNAVNNSLKHNQNLQVKIQIRAEIDREGGLLLITVTDNGNGIDFDRLAMRQNQLSSTQMIVDYLAALQAKTGIVVPNPEYKNVGPNNQHAQVSFFFPLELLEVFKKI